MFTRIAIVLFMAVSYCAVTRGQPAAFAPSEGNRWLVIYCGLPGDDEHRQRLMRACEQLINAAEPILDVKPEQIRILVGDEEMQAAIRDDVPSVGICSSESVAESIQQLSQEVQSIDACWFMLLGHASLYDNRSMFNVLDSDFDQNQFAQWTKEIACRRKVYWVTLPVSGFWIKPLSDQSSVVIAATEADLEFTGTEMPYALADMLAGDQEGDQQLADIDQDGSLSLLDLYLAVNLEITARFKSLDRLQTEHAQLDDNGDGRSSELQEPYLPAEEEDDSDIDDSGDDAEETSSEDDAAEPKRKPPRIITKANLDGFQSRHILINEPVVVEAGPDEKEAGDTEPDDADPADVASTKVESES